jgi:hypothetical protein
MTTKNILRVQKDKNNPYVQINKTILYDKRLSLKAKGLHCYMLSMPDDWIFYMDVMERDLKEGEKAIRSGLNELQKFGYGRRYPERENGKIARWVTLISEKPVDSWCKPCAVKASSTSPFCTSRKATSRKGSPTNNNSKLINNCNENNNVVLPDVLKEMLSKKIRSRLTKMIRFNQIQSEDVERLLIEIMFHAEHRPDGMEEAKSINAAFKMIRDGRWSTPKKMRRAASIELETKAANDKIEERNQLAASKLAQTVGEAMRVQYG